MQKSYEVRLINAKHNCLFMSADALHKTIINTVTG